MWLSIETSSRLVSLALGENGKCLREVAREGNASSLVADLQRELDVDFARVTRCVIGQGPGSYNGLRVGYAFLKGLLCLDPRPVAQIPAPLTLAIQALAGPGSPNGGSPAGFQGTASPPAFLVLNNARREEIHAVLVSVHDGLPRAEWQLTAPEAVVRENIPGRFDAVISHEFAPGEVRAFASERWLTLFPSAATAGVLAERLDPVGSPDLSRLEPHYVRAPVPEKKG